MRESLVSFVFFFLYKKKSDYIDGFDGSALGYIFEKGIGGVMHRCPDSMSTAGGSGWVGECERRGRGEKPHRWFPISK